MKTRPLTQEEKDLVYLINSPDPRTRDAHIKELVIDFTDLVERSLAVLKDFEGRMALYPDLNDQPHRVKVMGELKSLLDRLGATDNG